MANLYCNAGGDDSWDGTAQTHQGGTVGPWLTANKALDALALSTNDGNTLIFGDGTYTYSNNAGRCIFSHALVEIVPENEWGTTLIFSGTNSQGLRFNADTSTAEARTARIGRLYIKTEGAGKNYQVVISGNSASCQKMTVEFEARLIPPDSATGTVVGISQECSNVDFIAKGGAGAVGSSGVIYTPVTYLAGLTVVEINIDIQSWYFNLSCALADKQGGIILETNNPITGVWSVSGVTGSITDASASSGVVYGVRISKGPDGCSISDSDGLSVTLTNRSTRSLILFAIDAISTGGITTNNPRISGNRRCTANADEGFLAVIGGESNDHNTPGGIIEDNDIKCTPVSPTYGMHGIAHVGCSGGIRRNNIVDGASIASLTKLGSAVSYGNTYRNVGGGSRAFLYAKGAEAGTRFSSESCEIPSAFNGRVEMCLEDNGGQDSVGVEYIGTRVVKIGASDLSSSARLHTTGSGTDTSTSTSVGMTIDLGLTLPTTIAEVGASSYNTLSAANASASISGMQQVVIRPSTSSSRGIIGHGIIG